MLLRPSPLNDKKEKEDLLLLNAFYSQNGTEIQIVEDNKLWSEVKEPACCYYRNNINTGIVLYNSYTLSYLKQIIPTGYKILEYNDYKTLKTKRKISFRSSTGEFDGRYSYFWTNNGKIIYFTNNSNFIIYPTHNESLTKYGFAIPIKKGNRMKTFLLLIFLGFISSSLCNEIESRVLVRIDAGLSIYSIIYKDIEYIIVRDLDHGGVSIIPAAHQVLNKEQKAEKEIEQIKSSLTK